MWIRAASVALAVAAAGCGADEPEIDVLVFSRTTAYRHTGAIDAGRKALGERFDARATDDPAVFSDIRLRGVDVVVLLHTNGPGVLRGAQRAAFARWVRAGGGVVAVHAAANADRDWAFYGELLGGARFRDHRPGPLQREDVVVEDRSHPATAGLPERWPRADEWYRFDPEPGPAAHVLATVDGDPMVWWTAVERGRAIYTALGHAAQAWSEPRYREHVFGAVAWAALQTDHRLSMIRAGTEVRRRAWPWPRRSWGRSTGRTSSRSNGRRARRSCSGSTTTSTSRTRCRRCSSTSAAGG